MCVTRNDCICVRVARGMLAASIFTFRAISYDMFYSNLHKSVVDLAGEEIMNWNLIIQIDSINYDSIRKWGGHI